MERSFTLCVSVCYAMVCVRFVVCFCFCAFVVVVVVAPGIVCAIGLCVIYASLFIDAPTGVALFPKSRLSAAGVRSGQPKQTRTDPARHGQDQLETERERERPAWCEHAMSFGHGPLFLQIENP